MSSSSSSNGSHSMSDSTSVTQTPPLPSTSSTLALNSPPPPSNENNKANSSPPPLSSSSSSSPSPPAPPTSTFMPPPPKSPPPSLPPQLPSVSPLPPESSLPPSPPSSPPPSPSPSLSTSPPPQSSTSSLPSSPSPPPSSSPSLNPDSTPSSSPPPNTLSSSSSPPPPSSGETSYSYTPPPAPPYATSSSSSGTGSSPPPPSDHSKNSASMPPQGSGSLSNNSTTVMYVYGIADHLPNPPIIYSPGSPPQSWVNPNSTEQKNIHSPSEFGVSAIASSSGPTTSSPKLFPTEAVGNTTPANISSLLSSPSTGNTGTVVGVTMAGVFVIGIIFLAIGFVLRRRQRKRVEVYSPHYMAPLANGYGTDSPYTQGQFFAVNSFRIQGGYPVGDPESGVLNSGKTTFSYEELMEITNGFSHQNILGEGGFGSVYKGRLQDGREVAVKQLKAGSGQGEREFKAEVEIISRVHHRHLVSLVGYCISAQQRLLIYEFVPNQTLEHHLHGKGMPVLEWTKRLKIALGAARGLAYLHEDCHPKIIHRDIKSANILLDEAFEAQVADFGLARLANDANTHVSTRVMGTFGYLAPEYATSGKLTDRSDVFSFGVVLLELITGRKPVDPTQPVGEESLVEWARPLLIHTLDTGEFGELVDSCLGKQYVEGEMFKMIEAAGACVRHSAPKRPRMVQVARALDFEGEVRDLSNGVKVGQSTAYDSAQYDQEILTFRRMTFGSTDSSKHELHSGEFNSREVSESQLSWKSNDISSCESESQVFNPHGVSGPQTTNTTTTAAMSSG